MDMGVSKVIKAATEKHGYWLDSCTIEKAPSPNSTFISQSGPI